MIGNWNDVWNCLMGISAPISAIGMLIMTFYVYKLTSKGHKIENHFTHIVELYHKIEEDSRELISFDNDTSACTLNGRQEQCGRRIEVNSSIMIYYLMRIPGYYKKRMEFLGLLCNISRNPYNQDYYTQLSEKFKDFCWEIHDKKKTKHSFPFNYDGSPING